MTIVRVRPLGFDEYADPAAGDPTRTTLTDVFTAPRTTADITDRGRQGVVEGKTLYAPYGVDLLHSDQIEEDGVLYDIDGEAGQWKHPITGWEAGCEVALKRAAG